LKVLVLRERSRRAVGGHGEQTGGLPAEVRFRL
jgi:hypothetical protein